MDIKKGDTVKILAGKDSGKTGKAINVDLKNGKISVEGLNMFKKHVRPKKQGEKGEVVHLSRPMNISNAMLVCPDCHKATRVGHRVADKSKVRFCKKCQASI
jgi:large subunit ribosomal protein L24